MTQSLNTLIIDDHPLIIEAYTRALEHLSEVNSYLKFLVNTADSCDSANAIIEASVDKKSIDLVFLDISLPPSKKLMLSSGEDIGVKLRELFQNIKIIVVTSYTNNYRLINILKSFNPEGLLIKNELDFNSLTEAVMSVINETPYYSKTILKLLRQHIVNDINLDSIDRQLLHQLSLGTKTKDLPNILPLSLPGIEKRKRKLSIIFNVESKSDNGLLKAAREYGFL